MKSVKKYGRFLFLIVICLVFVLYQLTELNSIALLQILVKNYNGDSYKAVSDKLGLLVKYRCLPGAFCENTVYKSWVYYAPMSKWPLAGNKEPFSSPDKMTLSGLLTRQSSKSSVVQTLDLSKINGSLRFFIGIDNDDNGNIYLVTRNSNLLVKVEVNEYVFGSSKVEIVELPISQGGHWQNVLYYAGSVYVSSMGHSLFLRVDTSNFSDATIEVIDLAEIDPDALGYNGLCVDKKGFIWAAPNESKGVDNGKVLRIDPRNFTANGASTIDLSKIDPNLKGYHGTCSVGERVVFAPHSNSTELFHSKVVIIDINEPTIKGVTVFNAAEGNSNVGGMINCESVGNCVWFFPYLKNTEGNKFVGYGIITILNPETLDVFYLDMRDIFPASEIIPYDGGLGGRAVFLSPYKVVTDGIKYFDSRAVKIHIPSLVRGILWGRLKDFIKRQRT